MEESSREGIEGLWEEKHVGESKTAVQNTDLPRKNWRYV